MVTSRFVGLRDQLGRTTRYSRPHTTHSVGEYNTTVRYNDTVVLYFFTFTYVGRLYLWRRARGKLFYKIFK